MLEHVGDLVGPPAEVDRHADHAELGAGVVDGEELRAVAGREAQRVAAGVPAGGQAVRHPVHPGVELGVGPAPVAVDDGEPAGRAAGGAGQAVADVDPLERSTARFSDSAPIRRCLPRPGGTASRTSRQHARAGARPARDAGVPGGRRLDAPRSPCAPGRAHRRRRARAAVRAACAPTPRGSAAAAAQPPLVGRRAGADLAQPQPHEHRLVDGEPHLVADAGARAPRRPAGRSRPRPRPRAAAARMPSSSSAQQHGGLAVEVPVDRPTRRCRRPRRCRPCRPRGSRARRPVRRPRRGSAGGAGVAAPLIPGPGLRRPGRGASAALVTGTRSSRAAGISRRASAGTPPGPWPGGRAGWRRPRPRPAGRR